MIKVMICGILGRLGGAVLNSCEEAADIEVVCGIDHAASMPHSGPPVFSEFCTELPAADILVDCSGTDMQKQVLEYCARHSLPLLSCVTGYSSLQLSAFQHYSAYFPIIRCVNMASGLPHFLALLQQAVQQLKPHSVDITETHHALKRDAPSGTAQLIAAKLRAMGCTPTISSVRKTGAAATHEVTLSFCSQQLTLCHVTQSSEAYGEGAVQLLRQLCSLPAGLYQLP
ncbi:MAG: hypothetical protein IJP01_00790 [Oscillospiraceae bacterium]|nr:hypothetical protein [Oscillospiraceae bacterium]